MAGALLKALDRGEFRLLFQPKLDLATGNISGVEALLRWHSTDLGDIPPAVFIPIAEETALIVPIGEWVLREALITLKRWLNSGLTDITMAVNVSVLQLLLANLPEFLAQLSDTIQEQANAVAQEITETMVL